MDGVELQTPEERWAGLLRLADERLASPSALTFCSAIRACAQAPGGVNLNATDAEGYTLAQLCDAAWLDVLVELVRLGANPALGKWARTPACSATCVNMHPLWSETRLRVVGRSPEYYAFVMAFVASGRLELPPPCTCVRLCHTEAVKPFVERAHAARLEYRTALLATVLSVTGRAMPRDVWSFVVLAYLY